MKILSGAYVRRFGFYPPPYVLKAVLKKSLLSFETKEWIINKENFNFSYSPSLMRQKTGKRGIPLGVRL